MTFWQEWEHALRAALDDEPEPVYYCPHGVEVPTPGGACERCALEEADDSGGDDDWLGY